jgi:hypothetical protein
MDGMGIRFGIGIGSGGREWEGRMGNGESRISVILLSSTV